MKKIKYINALGAELELTNTAPFLLNNFTVSTNVNIYNSKNMNQDGANYLGNTLDIADITAQVTVIANSEENLINYKRKINIVFNPKLGEGWLIYIDDVKEIKIKCIVNKLPYPEVINNTINTCLINLTASNPFWQDMEQIKKEIALWLGDFEFPLEITESGIEMGHREPSLIVNVVNSGDVECGMEIVFKALATLTNPSLLNVNTQEYIKINKTMVAGEVLNISTYFGKKKVESILNGVETNAFNFIQDPNITFLQLNVGDNLFRYNADTGLDNLECEIYYTPQYLGV